MTTKRHAVVRTLRPLRRLSGSPAQRLHKKRAIAGIGARQLVLGRTCQRQQFQHFRSSKLLCVQWQSIRPGTPAVFLRTSGPAYAVVRTDWRRPYNQLGRADARRYSTTLDCISRRCPLQYEPTSLVKHSWANLPRFLAGFRATPNTDPDEDHNAFAHFAIACDCGSEMWRIRGYRPDPKLILCPLTLECTGCGRVGELFDIERHGYDAELGNGCFSRRMEGPEVDLHCANCEGHAFSATAVVSYQMEEEDIDDEMRPKLQDLFDTFALSITCSACGRRKTVCDYECA
jgi:hypothetical protein